MKTLQFLSALLLTAGVLSACENSDNKLKAITMNLSCDNAELSLEFSKNGEDALTISWTGGSDLADCVLYMDVEGNGFESASQNYLGKCPKRSVSLSSRDLNILIAELWPEELSHTTPFEFKVVASLNGDTVESNTGIVKIKSYGKPVENLWVIGSATSGGWLLGAAQKMTKGPGGEFTWKGKLTTGEIKFLLRTDSWDDFYGYGGDNNTLIYHPESMSGDPKFQILQLGEYKITLNTIELTISIEMLKEISARIVFLGDSITDNWDDHTTFFQDNGFVNSGISGQTTGQMLERVQSQVVAYKPELMVFLGGINDIARNQGYISNEDIMAHIKSIAMQAKEKGIKVILCSILPINDIYWNKSIVISEARELIIDMNKRILALCKEEDFYYCDYYSLMLDGNGGMNPSYSGDGLHPNKAGYAVMEPFILSAIQTVLK